MKNFKQALITVVTLTITFVIPVTVTSAIRNDSFDVGTKAQEITAQAAATVDSGFTQLSKTPSISLPLLGEVTIATLILSIVAILFLVLTIIAGINLLRPKQTDLE